MTTRVARWMVEKFVLLIAISVLGLALVILETIDALSDFGRATVAPWLRLWLLPSPFGYVATGVLLLVAMVGTIGGALFLASGFWAMFLRGIGVGAIRWTWYELATGTAVGTVVAVSSLVVLAALGEVLHALDGGSPSQHNGAPRVTTAG